MKIAWIGTGVMGKSMLLHLKEAGHEVLAYNRTMSKAADLKAKGVEVCDTIAQCVCNAEVVFTIVGYPSDVEEVYLGDEGILKHVKKHTICIDMTTSSPQLASHLAEVAKTYQVSILDAPVSGGDSGARAASLSIMVGGDKAAYDKVLPLFNCMGKSVLYMGEAGCGQHTKACNQIGVAGAVAAMSEAIHYARRNGLDEELMLKAIAGGAAGSWQINNTAPRVLKADFEPGFYIKHFVKDMQIIQDEMAKYAEHLEMLNKVCEMYEKLADAGLENAGTQALIKFYECE